MEDSNSKISEENKEKPFYKRIPRYIYNFIFELPFDNYQLYYKTGIIQKMSPEEKKKISRSVHKEELHKNFFVRLIKLRPQILDEEDQIHISEVNHNVQMKRAFFIIGLGLNWTYFCFNYIVLKKKKAKLFLWLNFILFMGLVWSARILSKENKLLYEKYKDIIKKDEVFEAMKRVYNIN